MVDLVRKRLCELIKSDDKEMCLLAVTIFMGTTKHYKDYFELRTEYDPKSVVLERQQEKMAFNMMYNSLDRETIMPYYRKMQRMHKRNIGSGLKMISLSSNQKKKRRKRISNRLK